MALVQSSPNAFHVQRRCLASTANPRFPPLHLPPPRPSPRCLEAWLPKPRTQTLHGLQRGLYLASLPSSSALGGGARQQGVREGAGLAPARAHADVSSSLGDEEFRPAAIEAARSGAAWIHLYLPAWIRPYALLARLDRPVGIWLFFWPCAWSLTMAANPGELPDAKLLALFFILSVFIRGAACTVNDYLDRDIDKKVERTKSRPLASGLVSPFQGISFFWLQVLASAGVFVLLNSCSRILGAFLLPLLSSYPLMKRFIYWPQGYLGFGANGGALLGWAAVKGSLEPAITLPLYVAGLFWTLLYDTIYAHQDKEDDIKAGVKSTAVKFGSSAKKWIAGFGIASIGALALSGYNAKLAWPYYPFLAIAAGHLAWQVVTVDLSNGPDCDSKFISNEWFGAFVFLGVLCGRLAV